MCVDWLVRALAGEKPGVWGGGAGGGVDGSNDGVAEWGGGVWGKG